MMLFIRRYRYAFATIVLLAGMALVGLSAFLLVPSVRQATLGAYSRYVLANTERFLPCDKLSDAEAASRIFNERVDLQQRLLAVDYSGISVQLERDAASAVGLDTWQCPGRADVLILVTGDQQHREVVGILGENFAGIPYRVVNY